MRVSSISVGFKHEDHTCNVLKMTIPVIYWSLFFSLSPPPVVHWAGSNFSFINLKRYFFLQHFDSMALTFGWTCLAVFPIRLMPSTSLDPRSLAAHGKRAKATCGLFAENIPSVIQTFWRRGRANMKQARRKTRRIKVKRKHLHPVQQLLPLNRTLIHVDPFIWFWYFDTLRRYISY